MRETNRTEIKSRVRDAVKEFFDLHRVRLLTYNELYHT